jgi:hypothetical protein
VAVIALYRFATNWDAEKRLAAREEQALQKIGHHPLFSTRGHGE